jgi:hypothetical protein
MIYSISRRTLPRGVTAALIAATVLFFVGSWQVSAETQRTAAEWVRESEAHKIAGYATLGLTAATAITGILDSDIHEPLGYATLGASAVTLSLGGIGYGEYARVYWPHILLSALATAGYALDAFVLEGGSTGHIATGATSAALLGTAILYLVLR